MNCFCLLVFLSTAINSFAQVNGQVDSIEFFNARTNQYYRTDMTAEIAEIDKNSTASGWVRTGQSYKLWRTQADAPPGAMAIAKTTSLDFSADPSSPKVCSFAKPGKAASGCIPQTSITYAMPVDAAGNCATNTQPIYRTSSATSTRHMNNLPVYQDMQDRGWTATGVSFCVPGVSTAKKTDAIRLLGQSTFGATDALVTKLEAMGVASWVEEQLNLPTSKYSSYATTAYVPYNPDATCTRDGTKPDTDPVNICARDNYTLFPVQLRFLQNALGGEDQLRQRVGFALSQILVVSGVKTYHPYGMSRYQNILLDGAFGNYRDVLYNVTLSPFMGRYLDLSNSNKPDVAKGTAPNENYPREVMQLFSIGLYMLNQDGSLKLDSQGKPIPSYSQDDVEGLAYALTGWTYPVVGGGTATRNNNVNYEAPMVAVESNHAKTAKVIVGGITIPANLTTQQDLNQAVNALFNHPNVGPFIGKQLIQKLVGGDPSPAYVARVAGVFNNNGSGVRGDMKSVIRAILLDTEARGEYKSSSTAGHLKEPLLYATAMLRGLGTTSDGVDLLRQMPSMSQSLFNSPSVFNFYSPDYAISGGSNGPEFEILNATTSFARANYANRIVMGTGVTPEAAVSGSTGTYVNWAPWQALAANPATLVDKLSWTFAAGNLSASAQQIIVNAVSAVAATDTLTRAKTAAYLVLTASQTQVLK